MDVTGRLVRDIWMPAHVSDLFGFSESQKVIQSDYQAML